MNICISFPYEWRMREKNPMILLFHTYVYYLIFFVIINFVFSADLIATSLRSKCKFWSRHLHGKKFIAVNICTSFLFDEDRRRSTIQGFNFLLRYGWWMCEKSDDIVILHISLLPDFACPVCASFSFDEDRRHSTIQGYHFLLRYGWWMMS